MAKSTFFMALLVISNTVSFDIHSVTAKANNGRMTHIKDAEPPSRLRVLLRADTGYEDEQEQQQRRGGDGRAQPPEALLRDNHHHEQRRQSHGQMRDVLSQADGAVLQTVFTPRPAGAEGLDHAHSEQRDDADNEQVTSKKRR